MMPQWLPQSLEPVTGASPPRPSVTSPPETQPPFVLAFVRFFVSAAPKAQKNSTWCYTHMYNQFAKRTWKTFRSVSQE